VHEGSQNQDEPDVGLRRRALPEKCDRRGRLSASRAIAHQTHLRPKLWQDLMARRGARRTRRHRCGGSTAEVRSIAPVQARTPIARATLRVTSYAQDRAEPTIQETAREDKDVAAEPACLRRRPALQGRPASRSGLLRVGHVRASLVRRPRADRHRADIERAAAPAVRQARFLRECDVSRRCTTGLCVQKGLRRSKFLDSILNGPDGHRMRRRGVTRARLASTVHGDAD